jgi:hypothetical protein
VPRELPPAWNQRHWIRHGGSSQLPVNLNVTGSPTTGAAGAEEYDAVSGGVEENGANSPGGGGSATTTPSVAVARPLVGSPLVILATTW